MPAFIAGLGQWLPTQIRENGEWPKEFLARAARPSLRELVDVDLSTSATSDPADEIARRYFESEAQDPFLGTHFRRIASKDMTAPKAEAMAAERALDSANVRAKEIDVVISWAAVPDRIVPPSAVKVAELIGAVHSYGFGMDAACATPITQLEVATALIESGRAKRVLLTQSHLITRTFSMMHPASPNVGDAATAIVVCEGQGPHLVSSHARTHGEYYEAVTWCRGREIDPPWWEPGPAFYLGSRDSAAAQKLVRSTVRFATTTIRELLTLAQTSADKVEVLVSIQPRRWIPKAISEALGVTWSTPETFDELAHLGGCGLVTNLIHASNIGLLKPGTKIVLYAQGAGFTRAAALLSW
jgi:3-oxoacyl-[acyl-carrier-protein] synthase-3